MGDEDDVGGKVPWRAVVLWVSASVIGGLVTWEFSQSQYITTVREVQLRNVNLIETHNEKINDIQRRIELIETTKVDGRFRAADWEAQRKILDSEFKSVWKAIEDCRRPR